MTETTVMRYKTKRAREKSVKQMRAKGWEPKKYWMEDRSRGCLTWVLLGIFTLLGKKPQYYVVMYERFRIMGV